MFFRCRRDTDAVWEGGVVLVDAEKVYCEDPTVVTMNSMMVSDAKQGGAVSLAALYLRLQSLSLAYGPAGNVAYEVKAPGCNVCHQVCRVNFFSWFMGGPLHEKEWGDK